jgi:hypothetical protein
VLAQQLQYTKVSRIGRWLESRFDKDPVDQVWPNIDLPSKWVLLRWWGQLPWRPSVLLIGIPIAVASGLKGLFLKWNFLGDTL